MCGKYEKRARAYLSENQENGSFQGERSMRPRKGTEEASACLTHLDGHLGCTAALPMRSDLGYQSNRIT